MGELHFCLLCPPCTALDHASSLSRKLAYVPGPTFGFVKLLASSGSHCTKWADEQHRQAGFESRLLPDLPLPFIPTLIGLRAFDLVSSRVWWEAATNIGNSPLRRRAREGEERSWYLVSSRKYELLSVFWDLSNFFTFFLLCFEWRLLYEMLKSEINFSYWKQRVALYFAKYNFYVYSWSRNITYLQLYMLDASGRSSVMTSLMHLRCIIVNMLCYGIMMIKCLKNKRMYAFLENVMSFSNTS